MQCVSSIYETAPVGYTDQADFLILWLEWKRYWMLKNCLHVCQEIEQGLGRVREIRWGPRTVDLDILLYNNDNIEAENLIVPHPRMHERAFVLIPLLEIAPAIAHPATRKVFSEEVAVRDSRCFSYGKRLMESSISSNEGMTRLQFIYFGEKQAIRL